MLTDQDYLRTRQYGDSSNLNARIALHQRFTTNPYGWFRWVFDHFNGLPPDAHILELGSGPCRLWVENLPRIPPGWTITLSDFSAGILGDGQAALGEARSRFHFEIIDAQAIPYPPGAFDAVIANHMLYHVPDRPKAFASIQHVLKPGGVFFAATNGERHMLETYTLSRKVHPVLAQAAQELISHRNFTLENGARQMAPWFQEVSLDTYEDALEVTEVGPMVDYLLSIAVLEKLALGREALRSGLEKVVAKEIAEHGMVRIEKATGLFIARRP